MSRFLGLKSLGTKASFMVFSSTLLLLREHFAFSSSREFFDERRWLTFIAVHLLLFKMGKLGQLSFLHDLYVSV